ncbi:condensin-2 complex subunit D3-like protein [Tanacetum coccineum]
MFIELKRLLESKNSPLTGSLMECLRILLKDYKSEIDEKLDADKQLQKELTYDMQKYETLKAKSTAAEAVSKGKSDVNQGAATPTLSAMNVPKLKSASGYKGNKSAAVLESLRRRQIFDSDDES